MSDDPNELFSEDEDRTAPPFDEGQEGTQETGDVGDGEKKSGVSADLIRGHINTIILRTLAEGDRYGYDIISEIEQKSHGQYSLKQPTLYSALKRLEAQGYVKSYWGGASGGGMGTSGLVGIFDLFRYTEGWVGYVGIILLMIVLPAVLNLVISEFMRKKGWIGEKDMKLDL